MLERVQKIMSNAGYCSRRKAEDLIAQGRVKVNGKMILLGDKADKDKDKITINDAPLKFAKPLYLVLNKPPGYVCSRDDPRVKKNIYELINTIERLYSVGRLDVMSEGIILLTNDGDFANKIAHPRYEVEKEYKVIVDRPFSGIDKMKVEAGMTIEDEKGMNIKIKDIKVKLDENDPEVVFFEVHEGQNRIIRKILKQLGYRIAKLVRTRIGAVQLKGLAVGKYRELTKGEIESLIKNIK